MSFPAKALAYFDESRTAWVAAGGVYGLWVGNSIGNLSLEAELLLEEDTVLEEVSGSALQKTRFPSWKVPESAGRSWTKPWPVWPARRGLCRCG